MKGESRLGKRAAAHLSTADSQAIAAQAFGCLASDPDQLGRFLALTGLMPDTIRAAARDPGFLPAVLSYIVADERLLLSVAEQIEVSPKRLLRAEQVLSPQAEHDP